MCRTWLYSSRETTLKSTLGPRFLIREISTLQLHHLKALCNPVKFSYLELRFHRFSNIVEIVADAFSRMILIYCEMPFSLWVCNLNLASRFVQDKNYNVTNII